MPISEYILLALLASGGVALPDTGASSAPSMTFGADAIVQPNGGSTTFAVQETPKKDGSLKTASHKGRRSHTKVRHNTVKQQKTPKKDG